MEPHASQDGSELRLRFAATTERDVWLQAAESCAAAEDGVSGTSQFKHQADLVALVNTNNPAETSAAAADGPPQSLHFRHRLAADSHSAPHHTTI